MYACILVRAMPGKAVKVLEAIKVLSASSRLFRSMEDTTSSPSSRLQTLTQ